MIIVVLVSIGINGCEGSARKSALRDYANSVNTVVNRSDATSKSLFGALSGKGGDAQQISQSVNTTEETARSVLHQAQHLSVPSSARTAQSHLVFALQLRLDGVSAIAAQIQAALGTSVRTSAVTSIAADMARFYASDVIYKDYTAPAIVSALNANSIAVGGDDGTPVSAGQFLPNLQWLTPKYVASELGVAISSTASGAGGSSSDHNTSKGLHGHELNSVTQDGTTLSTAATNSVTASPTPTFTLNFTNAGNFNEFGVTCKVTVTGANDSGTKVVAETTAGKTSSCNVTLSSPPPEGAPYTVVATIEKVPGETNLSNNTLSFPVTFH